MCGLNWFWRSEKYEIKKLERLISIRPIRMYRWAATGVTLVVTIAATMQRVSRAVLASMPAAIWIVFFDDGRFLFDNLEVNDKFNIPSRIIWIIYKKMQKWIKFNIWLQVKNKNKKNTKQMLCSIYKKPSNPHTSVRAQLQLIAVHRKMFINNIIRNRTPSAIASHNSQDGWTPSISQNDAISATKFIIIYKM